MLKRSRALARPGVEPRHDLKHLFVHRFEARKVSGNRLAIKHRAADLTASVSGVETVFRWRPVFGRRGDA